jgi:hypothetical protein
MDDGGRVRLQCAMVESCVEGGGIVVVEVNFAVEERSRKSSREEAALLM